MDSQRWRRVTGLFHGALGREPQAREAFLALACGEDAALRAQVQALLTAHVHAGAFGARSAAAVDRENSGIIGASYRAACQSGGVDDAGAPPAARPEADTIAAVLAAADDEGDPREPPGQAGSAPAAARLAPGTRLGPYAIGALLAEGGVGIVYRAWDTRLERPVAIKVLPPRNRLDPDRERRFLQEAKAVSALNHPNIVTVYDIRSAGRLLYISMEYVEGPSLAEAIGPAGLPLPDLLGIATQVAGALAAAHTRGIVHRDVKPGNVMIASGGVVKVLDFGLAKLAETMRRAATPWGGDAALETARGLILGTPAYMSPEQALARPIDARTDVFAFGSTVYEMATGQRAFTGANSFTTMRAVIEAEPPPLRSRRRDLPIRLERLIGRCLRKDPVERFPSLGDVHQELTSLKADLEAGRRSSAAALWVRLRGGRWWA